MLGWLPGAVLGKPKGSNDSTAILGLPSRLLESEELVVHSNGGLKVEAQNNLHAWNAAVNAVMP